MRTASWIVEWSYLCYPRVASQVPTRSPASMRKASSAVACLGPHPFAANESGSDAFNRNRSKARPALTQGGRQGQIGAKELIWQREAVMEHLLDFNAILGGKTEHSVAYAVSYIVLPRN